MNILKRLLISAITVSLIVLSVTPVFATDVEVSTRCRTNTKCDAYTMHRRVCDGTGGIGECILGYEDCANRNADCWKTDTSYKNTRHCGNGNGGRRGRCR